MLRLHCGQELVQQLQGARPEILNRRLETDSMNRYDGRNPLGEALADHADLLLDGQVPLNRGLKIQRPVQVKQFECVQVGRSPRARAILRDAYSVLLPGAVGVFVAAISGGTGGSRDGGK